MASTSLALDSAGNPVVGYYDTSNVALKVLHCNDPDCAGNDESIESPITPGNVGMGAGPSLALDPSGNPVVSYPGSGGIALLHCNDPNCTGGDESVAFPDPDAATIITFTSLALHGSGNPVVGYCAWTNLIGCTALKVVRCGNLDCTPSKAMRIATPDSLELGAWDVAVDLAGNLVVSYYDTANDDLKLLRCYNPTCTLGIDSDGDGCTDTQEAGPNEQLGGRRNAKNPWDFYDPSGNGLIDLFDDIFAVSDAFGLSPGDAGYSKTLDRSAPPLGADVWDMGPPDASMDLFTDIFGVSFQFGHSCH